MATNVPSPRSRGDECPADRRAEVDLVDRLALALEAFQVLVPSHNDEPDHDPMMQVDDLAGDADTPLDREGGERRVTPCHLELAEILRSHLPLPAQSSEDGRGARSGRCRAVARATGSDGAARCA